MDITDYQLLMKITGALIAVGSSVSVWQKIARNAKKAKLEQAAAVKQETREAISRAKLELHAKIDLQAVELDNYKESVNKEFNHIRETYNGEIRNLGEKIETLRSELRIQNGQIVNLLTKMIDRN